MTTGSPARTVLVVDDDPGVRDLLASTFELADWRVHVAGDGQAAIDALLEGPSPALVVVDMMMPGVSGFEVLQAMHAHPALSDVPRIVCSARDSGVEREVAHDLGAAEWLVKPVDPGALLAVAERLTTG